jgi:hypothetical protein
VQLNGVPLDVEPRERGSTAVDVDMCSTNMHSPGRQRRSKQAAGHLHTRPAGAVAEISSDLDSDDSEDDSDTDLVDYETLPQEKEADTDTTLVLPEPTPHGMSSRMAKKFSRVTMRSSHLVAAFLKLSRGKKLVMVFSDAESNLCP